MLKKDVLKTLVLVKHFSKVIWKQLSSFSKTIVYMLLKKRYCYIILYFKYNSTNLIFKHLIFLYLKSDEFITREGLILNLDIVNCYKKLAYNFYTNRNIKYSNLQSDDFMYKLIQNKSKQIFNYLC